MSEERSKNLLDHIEKVEHTHGFTYRRKRKEVETLRKGGRDCDDSKTNKN